jgi:hypothetical protein
MVIKEFLCKMEIQDVRNVNINLNHTVLALPPETTERRKHETRCRRLDESRASGTDGRTDAESCSL